MQNKIYKFVLIIALLLCGCRTSPPIQPCPPDIPIAKFQTADIAFRLGRTIESNLIASSGGDSTHYSHVGIIINRDSIPTVVHIEPTPNKNNDIIKEETLQEFFSPDKSLAGSVTRISNLTDRQRNTIQDRTLHLINSSITFDHSYTLSDSSTMYCTELIEHICSSIDISLSQGRTHKLPFIQEPIILPSDIAQNPTLITIWEY